MAYIVEYVSYIVPEPIAELEDVVAEPNYDGNVDAIDAGLPSKFV